MMLRTNPIREMIVKNASSSSKLSPDEMEKEMDNFKTDIPIMQQDAIRWIQSAVIRDFKPDIKELEELLRKVLFLNTLPAVPLSQFDQWPQEPDRSTLVQA